MPQERVARKDENREASFKNFYQKYRLRVYWYVYRKVCRSADAEDLTAETFLKLYENWNKVYSRGENGIMAWVYTVARNGSIDFLRKNKEKLYRSIDDEETDSAAKQFDNFVEEAMDNEDMSNLSRMIADLDDVEQEILALRYGEGFKFGDIAAVIGKNEGACKMILYRAIGKLRNKLNDLYARENAG